MKTIDCWGTDPENKGVYPRGEQKEGIDLGFVKEEDEEIESLISSEPFNFVGIKQMLEEVVKKEDARLYMMMRTYIMKVEEGVEKLETPKYPCYRIEREW